MRPLEWILIAGSLALVFAASSHHDSPDSGFAVKRNRDGKAQLSISRRHGHDSSTISHPVPWDRLRGLTPEMLNRSGDIRFEYVADAGTLICEGKTHLVRGAIGKYTLRPNPAFAAGLEKFGYAGQPTEDEVFWLIASGVTREMAETLPVPGVPATWTDLTKAASHGIDARYVREVRAAGYPKLDIDQMVDARNHGITAAYLASVRAAGYDVPLSDIIELRNHGVSTEYLTGLRQTGLRPSVREIVDLQNHGVRVEFVKALVDYDAAAVRDAIELSNHGVSADFLREVKALGYKLSPADLIEFRNHGVDARYLKKLADAGYTNLTTEKIIKLRDHGID